MAPSERDALARHANTPKVAANLRDRFPTRDTLEDAERLIAFANGRSPMTA